MKPRRVSEDDIERLSFETRCPIEYDLALGIAVLVVPGPPRREYVAAITKGRAS